MSGQGRFLYTRPYLVNGLICLLVFLSVLLVREQGVLQPLELSIYDMFTDYNAVYHDPAVEMGEIVVLTIRESDIKKYGWPIYDELMADALERVLAARPVAIGIDMYRDLPVPPGSDRLNRVLAGNDNIIVVTKFNQEAGARIPPPPAVDDPSRIGFNDIVVDEDGFVRRNLLFLDDGQEFLHSFGLQLALRYLTPRGVFPTADEQHPEYLRLGKSVLVIFEGHEGGYVAADASGYQVLADFSSSSRRIRTITLDEVLSGNAPEGFFSDRLVLIGVTADSVKDLFFMPVSQQPDSKLVHGVVLHGYLIKQLIDGALGNVESRRTTSDVHEYLWLLFWCVSGVLLTHYIRSLRWYLVVGVAGLAVLLSITQIYHRQGVWLPLVPQALGWFIASALVAFYSMTREKSSRAMLMSIFSKHVSGDIAQHLWEQRDEFMEDGRIKPRRLMATVLFTDLAGFTSVSEGMTPGELIDWLNVYMDRMTRTVLAHKGVVDKYIGDAIMVVFGIPVPRLSEAEVAEDARRAVECALEMSQELQTLNEELVAQGKDEIGMRVGIYTGPLIAGSLGSSERMDYTVLGDTVNTASRLESYDKSVTVCECNCRILIGGRTYHYIEDHFECSRIGDVKLKGKEESVSIYQVLGKK